MDENISRWDEATERALLPSRRLHSTNKINPAEVKLLHDMRSKTRGIAP
jgi:hypothetical protein